MTNTTNAFAAWKALPIEQRLEVAADAARLGREKNGMRIDMGRLDRGWSSQGQEATEGDIRVTGYQPYAFDIWNGVNPLLVGWPVECYREEGDSRGCWVRWPEPTTAQLRGLLD